MLRIAVQSKGRLYDETMMLLEEAGIKLNRGKRILLLSAKGFPVEVLFLRDDDIPQSVANGVADIGIVGENEYVEKGQEAKLIKRLVPKPTINLMDLTFFFFDDNIIAHFMFFVLFKCLQKNKAYTL